MKQKMLFIVNPVSGGINKKGLPDLIDKYLDHRLFDHKVRFWTDDLNAFDMAREGLRQGFDIIVSAGGDGTMNQVAAALRGSGKSMGIVPMGSGNGLARHLDIPLNTGRAIQKLNSPKRLMIDCMELNGKTFVNVAGTGFDAHIGHLFATAGTRGFSTYAGITLKELKNYRAADYRITVDGKEYSEKAFLISFANGSQWGNNAFIAPEASLTDGLVDVAIMKDFRWWQVPALAVNLFSRRFHHSSGVKIIRGKDVKVTCENESSIHMDGEPYPAVKEIIIRVIPACLEIIA